MSRRRHAPQNTLERPEHWSDHAACRGTPLTLFYGPASDDDHHPRETREEKAARIRTATALCTGCPVRRECLDDALGSTRQFGIWGGRTEEQRDSIRRKRNRNKTANPTPPANKPPPNSGTGRCTVCRCVFKLAKDGTLTSHPARPSGEKACDGRWLPPATDPPDTGRRPRQAVKHGPPASSPRSPDEQLREAS